MVARYAPVARLEPLFAIAFPFLLRKILSSYCYTMLYLEKLSLSRRASSAFLTLTLLLSFPLFRWKEPPLHSSMVVLLTVVGVAVARPVQVP